MRAARHLVGSPDMTPDVAELRKRLRYILHRGCVEIRNLAYAGGNDARIAALADILEFLPQFLEDDCEPDLLVIREQFEQYRAGYGEATYSYLASLDGSVGPTAYYSPSAYHWRPMSRLQTALTNIVFARKYTLRFLDSLPAADWFRMPPGGVTHIGWQVGHLAFSQYRLALERIRGPKPGDASLLSEPFLKSFGRDSVPDPDPTTHPSPEEVRAVFDRVHERVLAELPTVADATLDEAPVKPHQLCKTKLECLHWCSHHEAVHAGQIGLIRRLLGYPPIW